MPRRLSQLKGTPRQMIKGDIGTVQVLGEPARMLEELDRVDLAAAPRVTDGN